jgi:hypothetical protein
MKVYQSWKRNKPDTMTGESITVTIVYSSFDITEIDDLQKKMPKGVLVMDTKRMEKFDFGTTTVAT